MAKWWPTLPRKSSSFVVETTTFGHLVCLPMFNAKFASHFIFIVFDPWPFLHPLILEIKLLPFRLGSLGCCVVIIISGCCTTVQTTDANTWMWPSILLRELGPFSSGSLSSTSDPLFPFSKRKIEERALLVYIVRRPCASRWGYHTQHWREMDRR